MEYFKLINKIQENKRKTFVIAGIPSNIVNVVINMVLIILEIVRIIFGSYWLNAYAIDSLLWLATLLLLYIIL